MIYEIKMRIDHMKNVLPFSSWFQYQNLQNRSISFNSCPQEHFQESKNFPKFALFSFKTKKGNL